MSRNGSPLRASRTSSRTTAPGFSRSSGMPPSRGSSQPSGPRNSSFLMSTRGVTPPRHMMSSIITKSQLDVCGAPTRTPVRGTSPTAVQRVAHSTNLASRLLIVFLSRMPPAQRRPAPPRYGSAAAAREAGGWAPSRARARAPVKGRVTERERPPACRRGGSSGCLAAAPSPVPRDRRPGGPVAARGTKWGTLRLTDHGAAHRTQRSVMLGYVEDGPNLVTLAMNGWGPAEPAWWLNLQAHPEARVELPGRSAAGDRARGRGRGAGAAVGPVARDRREPRRLRRPAAARDRGGRARAGAVHPRGVMPGRAVLRAEHGRA